MEQRSFTRRVYDGLSFSPGLQAFLRGPFRELLRSPRTRRTVADILASSPPPHPAYGLSRRNLNALGRDMARITNRVFTTTSWEWLVMVGLKVLASPPPEEIPGDVVECGAFKGGSAACLSLVCRITGRRLKVYDSFLGLPPVRPGDRHAAGFQTGDYQGTLEEVRENITRQGAVSCCDFLEGWFEDTLPGLRSPVLAAFVDVVHEASLATCVRYLWPHLTEDGYLFLSGYEGTDYAALFWSERWWQKHFDRTPPGMVGGQAESVGYTMKSMSGYWSYYPDEDDRCASGKK